MEEEVLKAIEELKEKARNGWVIVVEGNKDKNALRLLGVEGEIVVFNGFSKTVEKLRGRKIVILTDYDEKGIKIEKGLIEVLSECRNVDVEIKKRIFCYLKKEVTKVEELYDYLMREGYVGF
ncbi:MAG: hypothetical protein QXR27_05125 [Archaeoglobaceae archaeon]